MENELVGNCNVDQVRVSYGELKPDSSAVLGFPLGQRGGKDGLEVFSRGWEGVWVDYYAFVSIFFTL